MSEQPDSFDSRKLSPAEIADYRSSTEAVSTWLGKRLTRHVETLRPLLLPSRHLGSHIRSARRSEPSPQADRVFQTLQESFEAISGDPLKLRGRLDSPIDSIPNKIDVWPWEYRRKIAEGDSSTWVTIESPFSWVLAYASSLNLAQALRLLRGQGSRSEPELRQFALRCLLIKNVFEISPGLVEIFEALRFRVDHVLCPETGRLPFLRLTADLPTFLPSDDVILEVTRLSGVARFAEIFDFEKTKDLPDPLIEKVADLSSSHAT